MDKNFRTRWQRVKDVESWFDASQIGRVGSEGSINLRRRDDQDLRGGIQLFVARSIFRHVPWCCVHPSHKDDQIGEVQGGGTWLMEPYCLAEAREVLESCRYLRSH